MKFENFHYIVGHGYMRLEDTCVRVNTFRHPLPSRQTVNGTREMKFQVFQADQMYAPQLE